MKKASAALKAARGSTQAATVSPRPRRRPHSSSYYTLAGRLLHQFGRQQRVLRTAGLPRFGNEQTYFLVRSPPLGIQLAVVAEGHLRDGGGGGR